MLSKSIIVSLQISHNYSSYVCTFYFHPSIYALEHNAIFNISPIDWDAFGNYWIRMFYESTHNTSLAPPNTEYLLMPLVTSYIRYGYIPVHRSVYEKGMNYFYWSQQPITVINF